jgi:GTP cyclohydrolase II
MKSDDYSIRCVAETCLPTKWGRFRALGFERPAETKLDTAVVLIMGDVLSGAPLVRIHSECFTGDVFGSQRCGCGEQLNWAMQAIAKEDSGIVIYERQEGRGIGLMAKLKTYELQDQGFDTVEANERLGYDADLRDFVLSANVLRFLGITQIRLLTNNPQKAEALDGAGIEVVQRLNCDVDTSPDEMSYLLTKKIRMGHISPFSNSWSPFVEQSVNGSPATDISREQRVHALRAEVNALQGLVCHLLEKNECLRMRLR